MIEWLLNNIVTVILLWWLVLTPTSFQALFSVPVDTTTAHSSPGSIKTANRKGKTKIWPPSLKHLKGVVSRESSLLPISSSLEVLFSLNRNPQPMKHFLLGVSLVLQIRLQETNLSPPSRRVVLLSNYSISVTASNFPTLQGRQIPWHYQ